MTPLDPIALTRRLVDIESITYNEAAVGAYLDNFLRERGFAVERTAVAQPPNSRYTGERFNVYAGNGKRPDVVLSTHMDTVPPFFPSSEDDLYLYGRGSCDAKGIIAAQVAAAERLREAGVVGRAAVRGGRGARFGRSAGGQSASQGKPFSDQWRAYRQPPGLSLKRSAAGGGQGPWHHGPFRLSGIGR